MVARLLKVYSHSNVETVNVWTRLQFSFFMYHFIALNKADLKTFEFFMLKSLS